MDQISLNQGINRNILECKGSGRWKNFNFAFTVLIETYWNVKQGIRKVSSFLQVRINRNILECKEKRRGVCVTHTGGINRNILECKVRLREIVSTRRSGINRNILECKGLSPPAVRHTAVRY